MLTPHTEAATAAILDGLSWLGLGWDGEPVSQAARAARHAEVAHALVEAGKQPPAEEMVPAACSALQLNPCCEEARYGKAQALKALDLSVMAAGPPSEADGRGPALGSH